MNCGKKSGSSDIFFEEPLFIRTNLIAKFDYQLASKILES
jgi:hypothetical protein